jgi:DnaJ-class molecular chaperone
MEAAKGSKQQIQYSGWSNAIPAAAPGLEGTSPETCGECGGNGQVKVSSAQPSA